MNYVEEWSQDPILRGDPLISGIKHENPYEVMKATDFVEKWLESTKEELSIEDLKKELTEFGPSVKTEIKTEIIIDSWYICFHCHISEESLEKLRKHIKTRHLFSRTKSFNKAPKMIKYFKSRPCPHCNYFSRFGGNLRRHMNEIHGLGKVQLYNCEYCSYSSKRKGELKLHIMSKHTFQYRFFCNICDYKAVKKKLLRRHICNKHSVRKRRFASKKMTLKMEQCAFCDYQGAYMKSHITYCHVKEKPFKCSFCNHKCKKLCDLNSHVKSVHKEDRRFPCPHCNYRGKRSSHVKSHINNRHKN